MENTRKLCIAVQTSSILVSPTKCKKTEIDPDTKMSSELSHYIFHGHLSSIDLEFSSRQVNDKLEDLVSTPIDTMREYDDIDENATTLRDDNTMLCVNCLECISKDLVDFHSSTCLLPVKSSEIIEEKPCKVIGHIRELKDEAEEKLVFPLMQLEEIGKSILDGSIVNFI